jgi:hypothetical protein
MARSLTYAQINREIIRAVSSNDTKEIIAVKPLLTVTVPTPACIHIRITLGALTIINTMGLTIANLGTFGITARIKRSTIRRYSKTLRIAQYAQFH